MVQKYGGTSVGSIENIKKIALRLSEQYRAHQRRTAVVVSAMAGETNRLVKLVNDISPHPDSKHYDMVVAAGEQVTVGLLSAALEAASVPAEPLLGYQLGIITDNFHSRAKIKLINTTKIEKAWSSGKIPIVAGFQGVTDDESVTTLGRGGSDITAVALAAALEADYCEINTDVQGVFSADPRMVPNAHLLKILDYDTALELAALGSKVLHSRCVEIGAKFQVSIIVRSSFCDDEKRSTRLMIFNESQALEASVVSGVTLDQNVAKITVRNSPSLPLLFSRIGEKEINVDIIVHDRNRDEDGVTVGFTLSTTDLPLALSSIRAIETKNPLVVESQEDLAKVSVVGLGMRSHSGVASQVFQLLEIQGIPILMVSTSEIKISCVIEKNHAEKAVQVLHKHFFGD